MELASVNDKGDKLVEEKKDDRLSRYRKKKDEEMNDEDRYELEQMRDLNNGPTSDEKRGCTDILCCLVFLVFIVGCAIVTGWGFKYGNPNTLVYLSDSNGVLCGGPGKGLEYPFVYYTKAKAWAMRNPEDDKGKSSIQLLKDINDVLQSGICLKDCPNTFANYDPEFENEVECYSENSPKCSVKNKDLYLSYKFLGKLCFYSKDSYAKEILKPDITPEQKEKITKEKKEISTSFVKMINNQGMLLYIADLYVSAPIIAASFGIAIVVGLLYLLFIRYCGKLVAYISIFLILVSLIGIGVYLQFTMMARFENSENQNYKNIMLAFSIICYVLAFIWLLVILCSCNKIRLSIAITEVSAKFVWSVMSIVFVPFVLFVIILGYIAFWVILMLFLYTSGELVQDGTTKISSYKYQDNIKYGIWFHIFAGIYVLSFIEAFSSFVYSSTACIWYFEGGANEKDVTRPVTRSVWRAFRYHLGSLAFGSLIIAIVRFIMVIVAYIRAQGEKEGSKVFKFILNCLLCCLACVEKCMEFINKHAYIMIALRGKNFCSSAWDGFCIVVTHLGDFSILSVIGGFFNMIGRIFIACFTALIGYLIIDHAYGAKLNSPLLPTVIFGVIGFLIGSIFVSIYGNASDSLLHCFLVDCDINTDAKYSPTELRSFIEEERENKKTG